MLDGLVGLREASRICTAPRGGALDARHVVDAVHERGRVKTAIAHAHHAEIGLKLKPAALPPKSCATATPKTGRLSSASRAAMARKWACSGPAVACLYAASKSEGKPESALSGHLSARALVNAARSSSVAGM